MAGEANVAAKTRILRKWIGSPPSSQTENWDDQLFRLLEKYLHDHPLSRLLWERHLENGLKE